MIYITCSKCGSTRLERGKYSEFICLDCGWNLSLSDVLWGKVEIEVKLQSVGIVLGKKITKVSNIIHQK